MVRNAFRFEVRAGEVSAADTPIRACRYFQAAQSDLCRQLKRNVGAVQSKATVRAALAASRPG
jgi:hypothetical protein